MPQRLPANGGEVDWGSSCWALECITKFLSQWLSLAGIWRQAHSKSHSNDSHCCLHDSWCLLNFLRQYHGLPSVLLSFTGAGPASQSNGSPSLFRLPSLLSSQAFPLIQFLILSWCLRLRGLGLTHYCPMSSNMISILQVRKLRQILTDMSWIGRT